MPGYVPGQRAAMRPPAGQAAAAACGSSGPGGSTGRTIKNVVIHVHDNYPSGSTCPRDGGGIFGSGNADPHEFDRVPFMTGFISSCHGRYTHTFTAVSGKTVFDRATATFVVK